MMSDSSASTTDGEANGTSLPKAAKELTDFEPLLISSSHKVQREESQSSWDFVEDHCDNEMFLCKICMCVLIEPLLITCCGECICKKCIDCHLLRVSSINDSRKKSCPFCRKDDFKLIENFDLKKSIYKLKVFCPCRKSGCTWSGMLKEGEAHLHECVFYPIDCPNGCKQGKIERCNLRKHIAKCPLQPVECVFESVGCKRENPIPRREIKAHLNQNIHQHLLLLAKTTSQTHENFDATIATLLSRQKEVLREKAEIIHSKEQELTKLEQDIKSLEAELFSLQQRADTLREKDGANCGKYFSKLKTGCKEVKELHTVCQMTSADFKALPEPCAENVSCPPVTFTVDHFSVRKAHNEKWISPPFYTHTGGYKMCLSVLPNGDGDDKGSYVSIFIHMMQGEFDNHLKWPFPGALINISALNQRMITGNIGADLNLFTGDSRECRSRVLNCPYGPGYGRRKYIDHRYLKQFLIKDKLMIMIFNIQFL